MRDGVHDEVDAELGGGVGFVGQRERIFAACPTRFEVERAINYPEITVQRDAFEVGRAQIRMLLEHRRRVLGFADPEHAAEDRMRDRDRLQLRFR